MRTQLYAIYDVISEVFNKPFTEFNDGSAIRAFTDAAKQNNFHNKDDLALYAIGEWDDNKGTIKAFDVPKKIYTGLEIKVGQSIDLEQQTKDMETFQNQSGI